MGQNDHDNGNDGGAARYLRKVLELAPEGEFVNEAREWLEKVQE